MDALVWETAEELDQKLAGRIRNIRKRRSISQGQISLVSLTRIAMALGIADELRNIFSQVPYRNIEEVINETR